MVATSPSPMREVEQLIAEQIRLFKQSVSLDDRDLLEYHLRHYFIMTLYREMDRDKAISLEPKPHLSMKIAVPAAENRELAVNRQ